MVDSEHSCKMCGRCCHMEIPITLLDIHRMAEHLMVADQRIFREHVQQKVSPRSSIFMIRKDEQEACVFLNDEKKCAIHPAKPRSCNFFICLSSESTNTDILPWTATLSDQSSRSMLWEQSIAVEMTKSYIQKNGTTWNKTDYQKAISGIHDNILSRDTQKMKLGRDRTGAPIHMIYDCSACRKRGEISHETPVTLDDIRRITGYLGISWKAFFRKKISSEISVSTGCLKLVRQGRCVFFHPEKHCTIEKTRPMFCRFTPCPVKTNNPETFDAFFLGSGTVEEQFRHQVAMAITRQYTAECGVVYNKHIVWKLLKKMDRLFSDYSELENFCKKIAPFRYVDDTLPILSHQR